MRFGLALVLLGAFACDARAAVHVTRLDPPRFIAAADSELEGEGPLNMVAVDFNLDSQVDFRFGSGPGWIGSLFDYPTRVVIRRINNPSSTNIHGVMGALPLGTVIGAALVSTVNTNVYIWHTGDTNQDDEILMYGNHRTGVIVALSQGPGFPLAVSGDAEDKEGVMAVEFLIGTNTHYGYIHFDFRKEAGFYPGGCLLGWAYESEPNTPITAAPIAVPPGPVRCGIQASGPGAFDLSWRATPGATYRIQGAATSTGPFTDFTPDIILPSGLDASLIIEVVTLSGMQSFPAYFWRVARTR